LDRNVVISIKHLLAGVPQSNSREIAALDKRGFVVSPLLSALEADQGANRNREAIAESLRLEASAVSRYFKKATTDSDFLASDPDAIATIFAPAFEREAVVEMEFVADLQRRLVTQSGKDVAEREFLEVASYIESKGQMLGHPASLIALACTLGSHYARKVLNPKKDPSAALTFNALADIEKIRLKNYIQHLDRTGRTYEICTFDKGLNAMAKAIRVNRSSNLPPPQPEYELVGYQYDFEVYFGQMPFVAGNSALKARLKHRFEKGL